MARIWVPKISGGELGAINEEQFLLFFAKATSEMVLDDDLVSDIVPQDRLVIEFTLEVNKR